MSSEVQDADSRSDVARALNRIADALFRQAKAAERAVALQEEMVTNQRQQARTAAALEQALQIEMAQRSRGG